MFSNSNIHLYLAVGFDVVIQGRRLGFEVTFGTVGFGVVVFRVIGFAVVGFGVVIFKVVGFGIVVFGAIGFGVVIQESRLGFDFSFEGLYTDVSLETSCVA